MYIKGQNMIILITGASHVGKTYFAQKLLEKYKVNLTMFVITSFVKSDNTMLLFVVAILHISFIDSLNSSSVTELCITPIDNTKTMKMQTQEITIFFFINYSFNNLRILPFELFSHLHHTFVLLPSC